ncbi:dynein heavy chain, partial [Kipferlia bialata]
ASVKMTTEPPKGIKANMLRLYNALTEETINRCNQDPQKDKVYRKLLFGVSFFHAILIERRKFGSLGFNVPYSFNTSDYSICVALLSMYLNLYDEVPWGALRYLTAEANYGGRVTDDWDRRVLRVYMNHLYCDAAIETDNFPIAPPLTEYYLPAQGGVQSYVDYIRTLSSVDNPAVFGQHPNADISSQRHESKALLDILVSMQPVLAETGEGGSSREARIDALAEQLLKDLPKTISNLPPIVSDMDDPQAPLTVCLLQEAERYQTLLDHLDSDIHNLRLGIKGLVVMSQYLDELASDLFNNKVPASWSTTFLSAKSLSTWVQDLKARIVQIQAWANNGPPRVMWLGGLTFPTAYLTALLQQAARQRECAIDSLTWDFEVTNAIDPVRDIKPSMVLGLGQGAYISGVFVEGAGWDVDLRCLKEPNPMQLETALPVIHLVPIEVSKLHRKNKKRDNGSLPAVFTAPCYYYPQRTGTREKPSFIIGIEVLTGALSQEHWIKRGVGLLLNVGD